MYVCMHVKQTHTHNNMLFSLSTTSFLCRFSSSEYSSSFSPPVLVCSRFCRSVGVCRSEAKDVEETTSIMLRLRCNAVSKARIEEYTNVLRSDLPAINWQGIVEDEEEHHTLNDEEREREVAVEEEEEEETLHVFSASTNRRIKEHVDSIKKMLGSLDDGEISISPYDTAWVALVPEIQGTSGGPQFPSSLDWIAGNQLPDGSWGDRHIFSAHDRIINTLACAVALKSWNVHSDKCSKGMSFLKENIRKLGDENAEHMPIGFEVAFPSLIEIARKLEIEVPEDSPVLQDIYAKRDLKLTRIPKERMHSVATTLLHSLEGMGGEELEWEKLLRLQCSDGSFLFSPSSTAFALIQTKDDHCLQYLTKAVQKFHGGVPNVYPVDLFEHIWVVDRLQRLGISRYFLSEIKDCIRYIYRYWTKEGICWARNSRVHDIDDTAMGFRLLRLHGYEVCADVFENFEDGGEFFCFVGQSNQAVTGMYNLYRASQLLFPGEKIMEEAMKYSSEFLREKQANNDLLDKWIITKDLPGEVGYALDVPWYASLPRVETRFYLEQYGGEDDVWIGKTLYRMPYVNNNKYLELAKLDFNECQALHQQEWNSIQLWYEKYNLEEYGMSRKSLLLAYYLAAASLFEPERSKERLAWAKTSTLLDTILSYFDGEIHRPSSSGAGRHHQRKSFFLHFRDCINNPHYVNCTRSRSKRMTTGHRLVGTLLATLHQFSLDALVAHGVDIHHHLCQAWEMWMLRWQEGSSVGRGGGEAELMALTLNLCAGRMVSEELLLLLSQQQPPPLYLRLSDLSNSLCNLLCPFQYNKNMSNIRSIEPGDKTAMKIESGMQQLVKLVLSKPSSSADDDIMIDEEVKQTFLAVVKSCYYAAYFDPGTINFHLAKVLFQRVH